MDGLGIDGVSQELDGCLGEFTLLIECDTCFPEVLEHFPEVLVMFHLFWCMDEDIIHVAYDPLKVC